MPLPQPVPPQGEYRIPKREIPAEVCMPGRPPLKVQLFLGENARSHGGPERPSDLLNGAGEFLPALDAGGKLLLLRRDAVMSAVVPAEAEFGEEGAGATESAEGAMRSEEVEIVLEDGTNLRGRITIVMPAGHNRLVDFLNEGERFLILRDGAAARLINKRRIAQVHLN